MGFTKRGKAKTNRDFMNNETNIPNASEATNGGVSENASEESPSTSGSLTRRQMIALAGMAAAGAATGLVPAPLFAAPTDEAATHSTVALSDLNLSLVDQDWNIAGVNQSVKKTPLTVAGRVFERGVGTHAQSRIVVQLAGEVRRFRALVGVDDSAGDKASIQFVVTGDGREMWRSATLKKGEVAASIDLDVSKVRWLVLSVESAGDGLESDYANWADAIFEGVSKRPAIFARLPAEENQFLPGRLWLDSKGERIQAHGGGIMRHEGKWWWHGEDRSRGYVGIGVSAYSSTDLKHWSHAGLVLPRASYGEKHGDQTLCERPKVVFNPLTKKFVMWFHYDRSGYGDSRAGIAVSDRPEGPFQFLGAIRPLESSTFRDMNLWVDDDSSAYVFYAGEENATMHVVRLNAEWTAPQMPMVENQTWKRILIKKMREAPAPFKHGGKYFLLTSGCTGWKPNRAELSVADNPLGPYESLGDPCVGMDAALTFRSQSTCVLPTPGAASGNFLYLGDRWKQESLADSRYIWLPFHLGGENGKETKIEWNPSWNLA